MDDLVYHVAIQTQSFIIHSRRLFCEITTVLRTALCFVRRYPRDLEDNDEARWSLEKRNRRTAFLKMICKECEFRTARHPVPLSPSYHLPILIMPQYVAPLSTPASRLSTLADPSSIRAE